MGGINTTAATEGLDMNALSAINWGVGIFFIVLAVATTAYLLWDSKKRKSDNKDSE